MMLGRLGMGLSPFRIGAAVSVPAWTPLSLGADLLAFWDAETLASITLAGSLVTSWVDRKNSYAAVQGTSGFRPIYSATSFNNRPGVTFDGTDDLLSAASHALPLGATPCEIWFCADQASPATGTTNRYGFSYGTTAGTTARVLRKAIASVINRLSVAVGSGGGTTGILETATVFSGLHVARAQIGATTTLASLDAGAAASAGVVPSTSAGAAIIGANGIGTSNWQGAVNAVIVTNPLTAGDAALLLSFLRTRAGV